VRRGSRREARGNCRLRSSSVVRLSRQTARSNICLAGPTRRGLRPVDFAQGDLTAGEQRPEQHAGRLGAGAACIGSRCAA
jgi:hypothetical protein